MKVKAGCLVGERNDDIKDRKVFYESWIYKERDNSKLS